MKGFLHLAVWLCLLLPTVWAADGNAGPFPKENPAAVYAGMKRAGINGSAWRRPLEDWAGARQRLAGDETWQQWFRAKRAGVDDWMTRHRDRVDWVAGWGHEFVSPKDGSFIKWTPEIPGEEVSTLASNSDPAIAVTPVIFRAWVVSFRGRHITTVQDAARLWQLTGDVRYAEWVENQLDFYALNRECWPVQDRFYGPSRLFGQPLMEAVYLGKLVESARLIWDHTTEEQRQAWWAKLFEPEVAMLNQSMHRIHNIACYLRATAAQVALLYDDQTMWREALDGPWGLRQQLRQGVTSDYLWFEQSMGYNEFAVSGLLPLFVAAGLADRAGEIADEMAIVLNMMLAPTWLRFPDDSLPNPADNSAMRLHYAPLKGALLRAYRVLPTPVGVAEAGRVKNWDTLIDPPEAGVGAPVALPIVKSRNFDSTRFAVLKAEGWQIFFHYGQLTGSHAQEELLNFEAFWGTTDISHDAYTVGYGSPMHQGYFSRGLSHNVALINGEGSARPPVDGDPASLPQRGTMIRFDPVAKVMTAEQPFYRPDAGVRRTLRIEAGSLWDEVTITSRAEALTRLGLALHLQGKVQPTTGLVPADAFCAGKPESFTYWRNVRVEQFRDEAGFDVTYASGQVFRVTFFVPGEFTVYLGSAPDSPVPARRDAFYIETQGRQATFKTRIVPLVDRIRILSQEALTNE